jgi:hypothetical protein
LVGNLEAIQIIYIIALLSSLAFGLEVLLLAVGGKLMVFYRKKRVAALSIAALAGLATTVPAVLTSAVLGLGPIYFGFVLFIYLIVVSLVVSVVVWAKPVKALAPATPKISDREMAKVLEDRGFGGLLKKDKKRERVPRRRAAHQE